MLVIGILMRMINTTTQNHKALLILLLIPMLWGLTFPLIKIASLDFNAESFVAIRCLLAMLVLLPFVFSRLFSFSNRKILQGLILGLLNGANIICQTQGLKKLDPASSAFITGIGVIFVPFLLPLFGLKKPTAMNYICSLLCLFGLYVLTGAILNKNMDGILWTVACALFYAVYVVYLQKIKPNKVDVMLFAFYQIMGSCLLATLIAFHDDFYIVFNLKTVFALSFCGVITTALVIIMQTQYQQYVSASQVILIYSLEALFASLFSYLLVQEHFTLCFTIGGLLMIASILLNELQPKLFIFKKLLNENDIT